MNHLTTIELADVLKAVKPSKNDSSSIASYVLLLSQWRVTARALAERLATQNPQFTNPKHFLTLCDFIENELEEAASEL